MQFRTELSIKAALDRIDLGNNIFTIGSCFAEVMGRFLQDHKFNVSNNPFGTSYNPISIHDILTSVINRTSPGDKSIIQSQGIFCDYNFHSSFSSEKKELLQEKITHEIQKSYQQIIHTDWILITYGTAWVYQRKDNGEIVNNCHKVPSDNFEKRLLTADEITKSFYTLVDLLNKVVPKVKIIMTVSPVRHVKDTLELNSVSKSILRVACHSISQSLPSVDYFPAYEIIMDDLRDYRFYQPDLIHPTPFAEQYIWEKFMDRYFSEETRKFVTQWSNIRNALQHRPFHPSSPAHQQFLRDTLLKIESLSSIVDVSHEKNMIMKQLENK